MTDWEAQYHSEAATVDRVWKALGISTYSDAGGKTIWELVAECKAQVTQAELETQRWVTAWGEVKRETERLRVERMDHPLARISDWLGKRVTDLEAGLLEALPYVEATHAGSGLADRLRTLVGDKK